MTHVAHLTSVHPLYDVRINTRECQSLAAAGYRVTLIGPPSPAVPLPPGIDYVVVRPSRRRLGRMTLGVLRVYRAARKTGASIYHLHDPELLLVAALLRLGGGRVVYDAHEDLPRQVLSKAWIPNRLRPILAAIVSAALPMTFWVTDAVAAATDEVARTYSRGHVITLWNYPRLDEFAAVDPQPYREREPYAVYVGVIAAVRGIHNLVRAMSLVEDPAIRLHIAGTPWPAGYADTLTATPGSDRVDLLGWSDRMAVAKLLGNALVGLVALPPAPENAALMPTKMFEYMAAGLPVIVSNVDSWRRIIDDAGAGIVVDPENPAAIAGAIDWCASHRDEADAMGRRGRLAVQGRYNWDTEAKKLLALYERLLMGRDRLGGGP